MGFASHTLPSNGDRSTMARWLNAHWTRPGGARQWFCLHVRAGAVTARDWPRDVTTRVARRRRAAAREQRSDQQHAVHEMRAAAARRWIERAMVGADRQE